MCPAPGRCTVMRPKVLPLNNSPPVTYRMAAGGGDPVIWMGSSTGDGDTVCTSRGDSVILAGATTAEWWPDGARFTT